MIPPRIYYRYTDVAPFVNTQARVESQLHCLEQAAKLLASLLTRINQSFKEGAISALSDKLLKFVDQFTYTNSTISSSKTDDNIRLAKVWNVID